MRYSQVSAGSWFYDQGIRRIFGLAILFQGTVRMWILMEIFGEEDVTFANFSKTTEMEGIDGIEGCISYLFLHNKYSTT